jgi:hypothetical protein
MIKRLNVSRRFMQICRFLLLMRNFSFVAASICSKFFRRGEFVRAEYAESQNDVADTLKIF